MAHVASMSSYDGRQPSEMCASSSLVFAFLYNLVYLKQGGNPDFVKDVSKKLFRKVRKFHILLDGKHRELAKIVLQEINRRHSYRKK
jgi:hypothetical protein